MKFNKLRRAPKSSEELRRAPKSSEELRRVEKRERNPKIIIDKIKINKIVLN
jgi:hypothetical protein